MIIWNVLDEQAKENLSDQYANQKPGKIINKHQLIFTRPQPTKYIQNETEKNKEVFGNIGMGRVTITY